MTTMKRRYNAEIQRAKGLLELAAAVYDTSLSFQTTRAAEQVLQTDSRVGYSLKLSLTTTRSQHENGVSLSFAADGFRAPDDCRRENFPRLDQPFGGRDVGLQGQKTVFEALAHKNARRLSFLRCRWFCRPRVHGCDVVSRDQTEENSSTAIYRSNDQARPHLQSDDVHGDGGHKSRWLYPGRHQEVGREDSVGIETEPSGPARGHRERDDRRRLRRRDQKLGADGRRSRLPLPACGGADPRAPDGDGLSPVRSAEVQISKYGRRRQHGGFQRLAHDRSRGHAG